MSDFDKYAACTDDECARMYYYQHPNMGPSMLASGFPDFMVDDGANRYADYVSKNLPNVMVKIRAWLKENA